MTEIKFRGYNAKHKKWLYGFYFENRGDGYITTGDLLDNPFSTPDDFKIERGSVSQYTGLNDKNGKEIYEGDISENGWAILFFQGMFAPYYDYGRQERYEDIGTNWWKDCEIIGNIYENPELIID